ncbi:MAG TPA: hypothetical protein VLH13_04660 [Methanomassiliicoccales archaeon]|nr:hypothetical protein [Methanomassiliicoccales archaeon]
MVRIPIKEVSSAHSLNGYGIARIPVTRPEGHRTAGSNFCVNISEIVFDSSDARPSTAHWTGFPFISMKH